nr:MAG TPA: hypothetical protein [Caudoviricetes sp.]
MLSMYQVVFAEQANDLTLSALFVNSNTDFTV